MWYPVHERSLRIALVGSSSSAAGAFSEKLVSLHDRVEAKDCHRRRHRVWCRAFERSFDARRVPLAFHDRRHHYLDLCANHAVDSS